MTQHLILSSKLLYNIGIDAGDNITNILFNKNIIIPCSSSIGFILPELDEEYIIKLIIGDYILAEHNIVLDIINIKSDEKKIFTCDICGTTFNRRDNLLKHKRNIHPNQETKQQETKVNIDNETKEEGKLQETKGESKQESKQVERGSQKPRFTIQHNVASFNFVPTSVPTITQPVIPNNIIETKQEVIQESKTNERNLQKLERMRLAEAEKRLLDMAKERERGRRRREEQRQKEGRVKQNYDQNFIEGESKEDRAKRLKKERQARWRANKNN
jgi:hypothetical protein